MRIKAKFKGQTSCGFITNAIYDIEIKKRGKWIWVFDNRSSAHCPYSNLQTLADNWIAPVSKDDGERITHLSPISNRVWDD